MQVTASKNLKEKALVAPLPIPRFFPIGVWMRRWASLFLLLAITGLILLPIFWLVKEIANPSTTLWTQLQDTVLPRMIKNTLILVVGVGIGTFTIGTGLAWLVTVYQFPGRAMFDKLLLLPLAVPTFVMGFIFLSTFDHPGPVQTRYRLLLNDEVRRWGLYLTDKIGLPSAAQTWLWDHFGEAPWFPNVLSAGGVIVVLTLVLYPYVYILARAAFREQSASTFEAAQVMGYNRTQTFFRLVLPMARPSLVAGMMLAMMEALTDYGTVKFFGYPTLSEGVVRMWEGRFDLKGATEIASLLLFFALGMIVLERTLRGQAKYYQQGVGKGRRIARISLRGWQRWAAMFLCLAVLSFAFFLPLTQLMVWATAEVRQPTVGMISADLFRDYVYNTARIAAMAAGVVIGVAIIVAQGMRANAVQGKRRLARFFVRLLSLGYAMPGAVIAVGVLTFVAPIDHQVSDFLETELGRTNPNLIFQGTIVALLYAYLVRFMAVGFNSVEASLDKVTPTIEEAARTMGAGWLRVTVRVQVPLISAGIAAGTLLIFVDVMKEIPTMLMLRPPFGHDTLALWAYFLASEAFWQAASLPSLTILVVGLVPVLLLMRVGEYRQHRV